MDAIEIVTLSFGDVHRALREDIAEVGDDLFWWQPGPSLNHIGFLSWHLIRDEDTVVSYAAGEPELWASEAWHARFNMDAKEQGTGLDPERIAGFRYEREDFMRYAERCWERTPAALAKLTAADLDRQAWPGSAWTLATQLVEGCIGHSWVHLGEIRAIKGLRGWRFRE